MDYKVNEDLSEEVKDLIGLCLRRNPEERPSIEIIKKHAYFKEIEFENLWKQNPPLSEKDLRMT